MNYGTSKVDGSRLTRVGHILQSVEDILTTPIGSRVERRDYGSRLFELVDKPMTSELVADFVAYTAQSLRTYEKRIKVKSVKLTAITEGCFEFDLVAVDILTDKQLKLDGIRV